MVVVEEKCWGCDYTRDLSRSVTLGQVYLRVFDVSIDLKERDEVHAGSRVSTRS